MTVSDSTTFLYHHHLVKDIIVPRCQSFEFDQHCDIDQIGKCSLGQSIIIIVSQVCVWVGELLIPILPLLFGPDSDPIRSLDRIIAPPILEPYAIGRAPDLDEFAKY